MSSLDDAAQGGPWLYLIGAILMLFLVSRAFRKDRSVQKSASCRPDDSEL